MSQILEYLSVPRTAAELNTARDQGILLNASGAAVCAGKSREAISQQYQRGKLPSGELVYGVVFHIDDVCAAYPDSEAAQIRRGSLTGADYESWWSSHRPADRGPKKVG